MAIAVQKKIHRKWNVLIIFSIYGNANGPNIKLAPNIAYPTYDCYEYNIVLQRPMIDKKSIVTPLIYNKLDIFVIIKKLLVFFYFFFFYFNGLTKCRLASN